MLDLVPVPSVPPRMNAEDRIEPVQCSICFMGEDGFILAALHIRGAQSKFDCAPALPKSQYRELHKSLALLNLDAHLDAVDIIM